MKNFWILPILAAVIFTHPSAFATDDKTPVAPTEIKPQQPGAAQASGVTSAETENNRLKTLNGSQSPFSGQFNITYQGSSLSHPFSADVGNPGNQNPPPPVSLSGTFSFRYRFDKTTTAGVGTGISMDTPFQGPKNVTAADPYLDIAKSYMIDTVHNRADLQLTYWTNNTYHNLFGYRGGLTASNDASYLFKFGLTVGFYLEFDYNTFSGDAPFSMSTPNNNPTLAQQVQWDLNTDPYFEYKLSDIVNLRSVIGIVMNNTRDLASDFALVHPNVYETIGAGVQVLPAWFIYPFVEFFPGNVQITHTIVGFNTIINLF